MIASLPILSPIYCLKVRFTLQIRDGLGYPEFCETIYSLYHNILADIRLIILNCARSSDEFACQTHTFHETLAYYETAMKLSII